MFDVVCIGNALIDSFLVIHEANSFCRLDSKTGEFCIKAGQKIPLENVQFVLGGNACNVSVGLKRLGLKASLVVEFGNDAFAHKIKKELEEEGIDISHSVNSQSMTSFGVGINFKNERSLFVWHATRKHDFNLNSIKAKWVYLSSIGESWRHVYRSIPSFIKATGSKLAFNPGTRQIAAGKEVLLPILAITDILFVNKEEGIRILYGKDRIITGNNKEQIKYIAYKLHAMGPKMIVITDGERGSNAIGYDNEFYHEGIIDAPVIEKTGAGDSFSTAFLSAIIKGHDISDALRWGTLNSASVIGKVGAHAGLLTEDQIKRKASVQDGSASG